MQGNWRIFGLLGREAGLCWWKMEAKKDDKVLLGQSIPSAGIIGQTL